MRSRTEFEALALGTPTPSDLGAFRLYGPSGKAGRAEARSQAVDRLLAKHGIRPKPRRASRSTMPTLSESLVPRTKTVRRTQPIQRTAAAKTAPPIYSDPFFTARQREAWEQRHAIVRHFANADIRVR